MTLASADWLIEHIEDPGLRVLDVRWYLADHARGAREYEAGHIPGAVFLDLESDLSDPSKLDAGRHPLPDPHVLASRLGAVGIGDSHRVVAYDHGPSDVAARAWWLLRHLGHPDALVLDGGIAAWTAAGGALSTVVPTHPPVAFVAAPRVDDTVGMERVANLGDAILVDARAPARFRGEVEPVDPVPGHIPGAVSLPYESLVGADSRLLPPSVLAARFAEAGVREETEAITMCGSGVTACHLILAAVIAGLPEPRLYPGSYSQWSTAGMPIAIGA